LRTDLRSIIGAILAAAAAHAVAAEAIIETPLRDPWAPPSLAKEARVGPGSSGTALQQEVERKLRARFDAAAGPDGRLTRGGAQAAGLGQIAQHFDAIDRARTGAITFDDYKAFLKARGAALQ
jgi:hypothetical protein